LNQFHIHGQDYGVYHDGGINFSKNASKVRLSEFKFRINERFLYEYDFGDRWEHEVRVEARSAPENKRTYPCCVGGQRRAPPEDCGGARAFIARRDEVPMQAEDLLEDLRDAANALDPARRAFVAANARAGFERRPTENLWSLVSRNEG